MSAEKQSQQYLWHLFFVLQSPILFLNWVIWGPTVVQAHLCYCAWFCLWVSAGSESYGELTISPLYRWVWLYWCKELVWADGRRNRTIKWFIDAPAPGWVSLVLLFNKQPSLFQSTKGWQLWVVWHVFCFVFMIFFFYDNQYSNNNNNKNVKNPSQSFPVFLLLLVICWCSWNGRHLHLWYLRAF